MSDFPVTRGGRERRQEILPKAPIEEEAASTKDRSSYSRRRRRLGATLQKKVISFIVQPSVIRRILKHLGLWEDPRSPSRPLELVCEPCADYVPWQDDVPEIEVG
ncbi:MAG: hypothetical protein K8S62_01875 [Candidatus Sabulitectum sp.]|nr:hypothetical protein [Candidatus Sabulitectum sp.]